MSRNQQDHQTKNGAEPVGMTVDKKIEERTQELEDLWKEVTKLQQTLREKQLATLRLDGAITQLQELQAEKIKSI